jgi:Flp pilus assembly protein TadD
MNTREESIRSEIRRCGKATPEILRRIEAALEESPSADLWILLGDAIQLSEGDTHSLDDAERSYERAMELEPSSPEPHQSLGNFHYAVMDDPAKAKTFFECAIALGGGESSRDGLQEAIAELRRRKFKETVAKINQKVRRRVPAFERVTLLTASNGTCSRSDTAAGNPGGSPRLRRNS